MKALVIGFALMASSISFASDDEAPVRWGCAPDGKLVVQIAAPSQGIFTVILPAHICGRDT
jgi:hypothetical protein